MLVESRKAIPHTEIDAARDQFEKDRCVNISGLLDPALLERALDEARQLSSRRKGIVRNRDFETVTTLRTPDPEREKALDRILQRMQEGAILLGSNIEPVFPGEKYLIELLEMEKDKRGPKQQYYTGLVGGIAITNLRGNSYLSIEDEESERIIDFHVEPGDIIIGDLSRNLTQQSMTRLDEERKGLAVTITAP